ncbi:MAG: hypothetical protein SOH81_00165 [Acetobacter sp.]
MIWLRYAIDGERRGSGFFWHSVPFRDRKARSGFGAGHQCQRNALFCMLAIDRTEGVRHETVP